MHAAKADVSEDASAETNPPASACERRNPTLDVSTDPSGAIAAGTPVTFTLTIQNLDDEGCAPEEFLTSITTPPEEPGFEVEPSSLRTPPLAAGERSTMAFTVSSLEDQEAGEYLLQFFLRSIANETESADSKVLTAQADRSYVIEEPAGCHVAVGRELLIRHPSVVDDPMRTTGSGAWTFGHLMKQQARSEDAGPALVESFLQSFTEKQTINGFEVAARPLLRGLVLNPWPRTDADELDLARAPLRLLAIAHRLDLADLPRGRAGEGRFVYGVTDSDGAPLVFTIIVEYVLAARTEAEYRDWAFAVHALRELPFPSEAYNQALQALTERYTARGAGHVIEGPDRFRIRSDENALGRDGRWEMREFHLDDAGDLRPAGLQQTPDVSWNGTSMLAEFVRANATSILSERHEVPATLADAPFQAGALINNLEYWKSPGLDAELRHVFSLNTCDGCHGGETGTSFFQVFPRQAGKPSQLSTFLTGEVGRDPDTGAERRYNELARRRQLLEAVVCD